MASKEYYETHKADIKAKAKAYYEANRTRILARLSLKTKPVFIASYEDHYEAAQREMTVEAYLKEVEECRQADIRMRDIDARIALLTPQERAKRKARMFTPEETVIANAFRKTEQLARMVAQLPDLSVAVKERGAALKHYINI